MHRSNHQFQKVSKNLGICFLFLQIILVQFAFGQNTTARHAWMISKNVEVFHYQPRPIDAEFGKLVSEKTIQLLDPNGLYFTQEDVTAINSKSLSIVQDIPNQKTDFLDFTTDLYRARLQKTEAIIKGFYSSPLQISSKALLVKKEGFFVTENDQKFLWGKILTARILKEYFSDMDSIEIALPPSKEKSEELKKIILDSEMERIDSKRKSNGGLEKFVGENYLRAIANSFDPHSDYFSVSDEQDFSNYLSKEISSFGFSLEQNERDEYEIVYLVPGSPAWKSGKLNEEDVILKASSKRKTINFETADYSKVQAFLTDEDLVTARFWVRKKNGEEVDFEMTKTTVEVEENLIESFILEGDKKIAYLYLPSFYSKGDDVFSFATGCANDIAKELLQLQNEGVEALVFDLRSNGGGSMLEAILLAGIFIDYGALSIYDSKDEDPQTLKDINRGILFEEPMVVLVNKYSASASELFAAAMQDHNRALIVGSPTYGKSTAQNVIPIDAYKSGEDEAKWNGSPEAYVKMTGAAFYRVTGKTHQKTGIIPDIHLPDYFSSEKYGEQYEPAVLSFDAIDKKTYYYPFEELPVAALKAKSETRIGQKEIFNKILKVNSEARDNYSLPLNFEGYKSAILDLEEEDYTENSEAYKVLNPTYIAGRNDVHIGSEIMNTILKEDLQNDIYINEAYLILLDLLQIQNK